MINSDAKLFTKLIANRIHTVLPNIINPCQTGFMHHRLISDNGWVSQTLMRHVQKVDPHDSSVAVLLDQEKAYDRVHPQYIQAIMEHIGLPKRLVDTLIALFFSTKVHVSINGWLAAPFQQGRGLRQGDPLSPLLFNIAFEPLLRSILCNHAIQGIRIPDTVGWRSTVNLAVA
ncbi:hypothetical protein, partial, partial [Absidia glauca]